MKYSATVLLFAAAVFWTSASARPHPNSRQEIRINVFTQELIKTLRETIPEPHSTILINKVHEARHQHFDNYEEYENYIRSLLAKYFQQVFLEELRGKSDVLIALFADFLVSVSPPADQEALLEKYTEAFEKDYESEDDLVVELVKIFEEETGLSLKEIQADKENFADFMKKFTAKFVIEHGPLIPEQTDFSKKD